MRSRSLRLLASVLLIPYGMLAVCGSGLHSLLDCHHHAGHCGVHAGLSESHADEGTGSHEHAHDHHHTCSQHACTERDSAELASTEPTCTESPDHSHGTCLICDWLGQAQTHVIPHVPAAVHTPPPQVVCIGRVTAATRLPGIAFARGPPSRCA